ncbi:MAG: outer membrane protein assembly factor BamE, partial [Prevotella bivia]|nr:outer membrane protein assembly factor BamE [Prevotella bivia]
MKNVDKLEVGMDMSEVKALIGNPSERSADHEEEVWIYYYMRSLIYRVTTITFNQRKVVAFETTTNDDMYKDANLS